ncbi:hypothetical protein [Azospirillum sp. sgz302134]
MKPSPDNPRYRLTVATDKGLLAVVARHISRNRPARPHELVRAMERGRMAEALVRETVREWTVLLAGHHRATVRPTPNGAYAWNGIVSRDLLTLARRAVGSPALTSAPEEIA